MSSARLSAEGFKPQKQRTQSYVTDDKIYCDYVIPNEEMIH